MDNAPQRVWPSDVDGDVFRRLDAARFDFSKEVDIDFNIDFKTWPPSPDLIRSLEKQFANVKVYTPDSDGDGYVQVSLRTLVTYDLVMSMQATLTGLAATDGGVCESWGVLQD